MKHLPTFTLVFCSVLVVGCSPGAATDNSATGSNALAGQVDSGPTCGNGLQEGTEECDFGEQNGTSDATCDAECHRILPGLPPRVMEDGLEDPSPTNGNIDNCKKALLRVQTMNVLSMATSELLVSHKLDLPIPLSEPTEFCATTGDECGSMIQLLSKEEAGMVGRLAQFRDPDVSSDNPGLGYALQIPENGMPIVTSMMGFPLVELLHCEIESRRMFDEPNFPPPPLTAEQLPAARDAQRRADVNTVINAIYQYQIDNNGKLPFEITPGETIELCRSQRDDCDGKVNLSALEGSYVVRIPQDPTANTEEPGAGYFITVSDNGRITVTATGEVNGDISVTR